MHPSSQLLAILCLWRQWWCHWFSLSMRGCTPIVTLQSNPGQACFVESCEGGGVGGGMFFCSILAALLTIASLQPVQFSASNSHISGSVSQATVSRLQTSLKQRAGLPTRQVPRGGSLKSISLGMRPSYILRTCPRHRMCHCLSRAYTAKTDIWACKCIWNIVKFA